MIRKQGKDTYNRFGLCLFGGLDSGLDSGTGMWDWTQSKLHSSFRVTETTQKIYSFQLTKDVSFQLQHSCHFGANLHTIVLCNSCPDVDFRGK